MSEDEGSNDGNEDNAEVAKAFLAQFAATNPAALGGLSDGHSWRQSQFIKDCTTMLAATALLIYASRVLRLNTDKAKVDAWVAKLQQEAGALSAVPEDDEEALTEQLETFVTALIIIMVEAGEDPPRSLTELRTRQKPKEAEEKEDTEKNQNAKDKPKPKAVISKGLTINPFKFREELGKKVVRNG